MSLASSLLSWQKVGKRACQRGPAPSLSTPLFHGEQAGHSLEEENDPLKGSSVHGCGCLNHWKQRNGLVTGNKMVFYLQVTKGTSQAGYAGVLAQKTS